MTIKTNRGMKIYANQFGYTVARAETLGLDPESPWYVACDQHGAVVAVATKGDGMTVSGEDFCDECRA